MATYKLTADLDGTSSPLQAKSPLTGELLTGKLVAGTTKTYEVLVPNITMPTSSIELAVDGAVFTTASVDEGKGPALPTLFNATAGTYEIKGKGTVLVSQGRVHKATTALIRTTEKGAIRQAGVYSFAAWDGKDEDGVAVNQDDYLPMVQVSRVEVRWDKFGNTSDSYTQNVWRGILQPHDVCQAPDGSLVWPVGFNEGKSAIYKTLPGKPNAPIALIAPDYRETICFVAVVGSLVLGAVNSSGHNLRSSTYVRAWRLSDGQSVPFSGGVDATIQQHDQTGIRRGVASLMESPAAADSDFDTKRANWFTNRITGLAILGDYLVIARKAQNKLYFLNKNTGALIFTQSVAAPGQLAAHTSGALLVVTAGTVKRYTLLGAQLTQENTLPGIGLAVGVDCHPTQDIIAVADASTDQVLRFKADGTPLASLGQSGGYTNTAVVAVDRFCFRYRDKIPGGVPQDRDPDGTPFALLRFLSDGSFYIGSQQLCRVQRFGADLSYQGQVAYISDTLTVAADVNDPTTVFSGLCRYKVSLEEQKPGDQSLAANPTWQLTAYYGGSGTNPDPAKYKTISDAISHTFTGGNGRLYARLNDESLVGQPAMTLEVEVLPNRLLATKNRLPGYGNSNHNFMNQPDGRVIAFARTDTSTAGVFTYAPVSRAITGYDGNSPVRGNATPLMALKAGEIYYRADLTKSTRDPVPEKVTGDGIRIGQTTNGRIWTYQGRMLFDPDPTTKQLTVPRSGTFHLGAVEPGGTTFAVRTHQGKSGNVNTGDGAYPEPTTPAFGGLDGTNFSVLGRFVSTYYGGQYALPSNWFNSFYETGLLAASFGVPIIDPAKYSDDAATAGYAGNALEMVGSIGPNNSQYFYLPDEAEHGAVHRYCLSKTDKVEVFTFPAQAAPGPVGSDARVAPDPATGPPNVDGSPIELRSEMRDGDGVIRPRGVFKSTNPSIAAISCNAGGTPIDLREAIIISAGRGVSGGDYTNITIRDASFYGLNTTVDNNVRERNIHLSKSSNVDIQYVTIETGGGIYCEEWLGNHTPSQSLKIQNVKARDIIGSNGAGPDGHGGYRSIIQLKDIHTKGMRLAYIEGYNRPGKSRIEDTINLFRSGGFDANNPLLGYGFYLHGSYPFGELNSLYTGAAISIDGGYDTSAGELPAAYNLLEEIWCLSNCNAACNIAVGHDNTIRKIRAITTGYLPDGRRLNSTFRGFSINDFYSQGDGYNNTISGIETHFERTKDLPDGTTRRADFIADPNVASDIPHPGIDVANAILLPATPTPEARAAQEAKAFKDWIAFLNLNGQTCGSRYKPS